MLQIILDAGVMIICFKTANACTNNLWGGFQIYTKMQVYGGDSSADLHHDKGSPLSLMCSSSFISSSIYENKELKYGPEIINGATGSIHTPPDEALIGQTGSQH